MDIGIRLGTHVRNLHALALRRQGRLLLRRDRLSLRAELLAYRDRKRSLLASQTDAIAVAACAVSVAITDRIERKGRTTQRARQADHALLRITASVRGTALSLRRVQGTDIGRCGRLKLTIGARRTALRGAHVTGLSNLQQRKAAIPRAESICGAGWDAALTRAPNRRARKQDAITARQRRRNGRIAALNALPLGFQTLFGGLRIKEHVAVSDVGLQAVGQTIKA